jgi:aspartate carbamoyltransferase catalytic subunit
MSTLFYEPSTRTRLSFEGAMGRARHMSPLRNIDTRFESSFLELNGILRRGEQ